MPEIAKNRFLPGIQGKDYHLVVAPNGHTYAVYTVRVKGRAVKTAWRIPKDKMKAWGIGKDEGREIGREAFKNLNVFGPATDVVVHGEKRHPFHAWVEKASARYGGTGLLKNREVMSVFLMGYAEGWNQEDIQGALRQTKWYNNRTRYQRDWQINTSKKERQSTIANTTTKLKDAFEDLYGSAWRKHVKGGAGQIRKWGEKIASGTFGAYGDPQSAMEEFLRRHRKRAERIENTPAWIARKEEGVQQAEFLGRPEELFEQMRSDSIEWLGYRGRPDTKTLRQWADDIAFGKVKKGNPVTYADFTALLRKQKEALYPYLDPDEKWQDRASIYKNVAENLFGTPVNWTDKLLSDFTAKDKDGNPRGEGKVALSAVDFEKLARSDRRFWKGSTAREEGFGLRNMLQQMFLGG